MASNPYKRKFVKDGHPKGEHILVAELALGKKLPQGSPVHHFNENRRDNRNKNLVICQNAAYDQLLHKRTRAFEACGNANWHKCSYCKQYDSPDRITVVIRSTGGELCYHKTCNARAAYNYRHENLGVQNAV